MPADCAVFVRREAATDRRVDAEQLQNVAPMRAAVTRSGSVPPVRFIAWLSSAAIDENDFVCCANVEEVRRRRHQAIAVAHVRHADDTARGSRNGSGLSRTPSMTLKIAVVAPIASASVNAAIAVKPGVRESFRAA